MANTLQNETPQNKQEELTNTYTSRLLGYIRDDNIAFSNFIKDFDKYVNTAGGVLVYTCDSHNQPAQKIDDDTDLVYLERLINKLGISLDYFPSDYNKEEDTNNIQLKQLYQTAIRGAVINRTGGATKASIKEALEKMYPQGTIEIIDGGVPSTETENVGIMSAYIHIKNLSATINNAILSLYLKQNITGVQEVFEFDVDGTGVFAPIYAYPEKTSTDDIEEVNAEDLKNIFPSDLNNYVPSDLPSLRPYNYDEELSRTGKGGYMFMNYNPESRMEEAITSNELVYLNTGFWLISLI